MSAICRAWDRLLWLSDERLASIWRHGDTDDEVRRRVRVERVEEALAQARADPFVGLLWLGDDLVRRRARWAHLHPTPGTRRRRAFGRSRWRLGIALAVAALSAILAAVFWFMAFGLAALLLVVPFSWRRDEEDPASFDMDRCPDCGYGLNGVPDAIPAERVGAGTGPGACPECGAPWPLVPPPA